MCGTPAPPAGNSLRLNRNPVLCPDLHGGGRAAGCDTPTVVRPVKDLAAFAPTGRPQAVRTWHPERMGLTVRLTGEEHAKLLAGLDALGLPDVDAAVRAALGLLHCHALDEAARATMSTDVTAWYAAHPQERPTSLLAPLLDPL